MTARLISMVAIGCLTLFSQLAVAADADYLLGAGDSIRINVFQNLDLTLETRVSESGTISYPLVGNVKVGGSTIEVAERSIAKALEDGGFVKAPQVNIMLLLTRGNQISIIGQVNRPGRYALEGHKMNIVDALALAGGAINTGSDTVILSGVREDGVYRTEVDLAALFMSEKKHEDTLVMAGDQLYVHRAPVFYIYGEAQRPSAYRVERNMTMMQALALGGGPTIRGTQRSMKLNRRNADGVVVQTAPKLTELIKPDDVIYVEESLF